MTLSGDYWTLALKPRRAVLPSTGFPQLCKKEELGLCLTFFSV